MMTVKAFLVQMLAVLFILVVGILIWNFVNSFQARP